MPKFHVKRGDEVVVISGEERGQRGRILMVLPEKQRVIVEGRQMVKRHTRKSQQHPQGAIIEREGSIHISNVMQVSKYDERAARRAERQPRPPEPAQPPEPTPSEPPPAPTPETNPS